MWRKVNFFGSPVLAWVTGKEFWPNDGPKNMVWAQLSGDEFNPYRWFKLWD